MPHIIYSGQETEGAESDVRLTLLYEGTKAIWRLKRNATFIIIDHKVRRSLATVSSCIEVIAYTSSLDTNDADTVIEVPRLYLSSKKIFARLKPSDLQIGGLSVAEGTWYAQKLIAAFIFDRITMISKVGNYGECPFEVELQAIGEDLTSPDDSGPCRRRIDVNFDGDIKDNVLGQLPSFRNIK